MQSFNKITTSNLPQTNGTNGQLVHLNGNNSLERKSKQDESEFLEAMYLVVDDSFELSSQNATDAEKTVRAEAWARVLFGVIPENRLPDAFDRAFQLHDSSFPVNAYEIKLAWEKIKSEEYEAKIKNQIVECPGAKYHRGESTVNGFYVVLMNPHTQKDELYPCPKCRMEDFENKKKTDIALYGEIKPMIILEKMVEAEKPKVAAETLSLEEIAKLEIEHNSLVEKIAGEGAKDLLIMWDSGADCFTRKKYRAQTFSVSVVRKMIEDYRKL